MSGARRRLRGRRVRLWALGSVQAVGTYPLPGIGLALRFAWIFGSTGPPQNSKIDSHQFSKVFGEWVSKSPTGRVAPEYNSLVEESGAVGPECVDVPVAQMVEMNHKNLVSHTSQHVHHQNL